MSSSIFLKGCVGVTKLNHLLEIPGQEASNGAGVFILVDVTELVSEQARSLAPLTDKDGVSQSEADHIGRQQASLQCSFTKNWILE